MADDPKTVVHFWNIEVDDPECWEVPPRKTVWDWQVTMPDGQIIDPPEEHQHLPHITAVEDRVASLYPDAEVIRTPHMPLRHDPVPEPVHPDAD